MVEVPMSSSVLPPKSICTLSCSRADFNSPEVVGMSPALKMGFELLRPWGVISSVGVHNAEVSPKDH